MEIPGQQRCSSEQLIELLDSVDCGLIALDWTGNIQHINRFAAEQLRLESRPVQGQAIWDVLPYLEAGQAQSAFQQSLQKEQPTTLEWLDPSQRKWFSLRFNPAVHGFSLVLQDITAQKKIAEAHRMTTDMLDKISQVNPAVIYLFDIETPSNIYFNKDIQKLLGYSEERISNEIGAFPKELMHPEDYERFSSYIKNIQSQPDGIKSAFEYRVRHADGSWHWFLSENTAFERDDSGKATKILGSALDITKQKQAFTELAVTNEVLGAANLRLQESEQRFRSTFENAAVGIAHIGLNGELLRVNDRLCGITGYSREELHGKTFQEITHPEDLQPQMEQHEAMLRGEIRGYQIEKRYVTRNGRVIWGQVTSTLLRDENGQPLYSIAILQDITRRKRLEDHDRFLIEVGEQLARAQTGKEAVELVALRVGDYLELDRCVFAEIDEASNSGFMRTGYRRNGEPISPGPYPLGSIPHEILQDLKAGRQTVVVDTRTDPRTVFRYETTYGPRKIGSFVHTPTIQNNRWVATFYITNETPRDWRSEDLELLHSVTDLLWLTISKIRLLASLQESEERFRVSLDRTGVTTFRQDLDLRYTWIYNPRAEFNLEVAVGKSDYELSTQIDIQAILALKQQVLKTGKKVHQEVQATLYGKVYYYDMVIEPSRDELGKVNGLSGSIINITDRKEAEEAIREYALKLERSNQDLQDFAFIASHDLQEPLRKVKAFGDRLKATYSDALPDEARDYLERMVNASDRMRKMIDDLLAYSRVSTKTRPFTAVDLNVIAKEVVSDLEARIESTGGTVELNPLPTIEADAAQIRQLFQNLIGNALKFHRAGVPPVVRLESRALDDTAYEITVMDNGIGFDTQFLERIFQPFQRLHGRNEYEGSGIGLAICRKIVERHKGEITAVSQPGGGSQFLIRLPVKHS